MSVFSKDKKEIPVFASRAEAFAYMLAYQVEEKHADHMDAAQRANEFADIFAKNTGLPQAIEPKKQGVDKYIDNINKVVCYCEEHPRVIEFITGAATFAVGLFTGKKIEEKEMPKAEPIDFDKVD